MTFPIVQLGDLCVMDRQGLGPDDSAAARLPYVGVENVESHNGNINFANGSRVGNQKSTAFRFDERHILYAKLRPYLNKVATPDFAGKCSTELIPLLPQSGVDREFIAHLLRRKQTVEYVMASVTGSRMPRTDMKELMALSVSLPPLAEQRRIVGILNRAARIERLRRQAQERLQEFIPALFVKIFGDPAINPMGWETAPLGNVCTIVGGGTPSRKVQQYWRGNIPWVSVKDFRSDLISEAEEFISQDGLKNSASKIVSPGTLLLVTRVGLGKVAMAGVDLAINQDIKAIMPHNHLLPEFLLWSLKHLGPEIASKGTGATVKGVTLQYVKELEILLPPLSNQQHFVDLVKRSRSICTRTVARSATATALSASLMSRLLEDCP